MKMQDRRQKNKGRRKRKLNRRKLKQNLDRGMIMKK